MAKKSSTPPKGFKKLQCKYCDVICDRVDEKADAITCSRCTQRLVNGERLAVRK
jgi:hypothetical protein